MNLPCGIWCSDEDVLKQEALSFFKGLFCVPSSSSPHALVSPSVPGLPHEGALALRNAITHDEVRLAISHMGSFKAPGPDGFQAIFFKQFWHIVGEDVWRVVHDAFAQGNFDPSLPIH